MNTLKLLHDPEALKQAAKAGATWRDLAAIIGVAERTLRRWRNELEDAEHYTDELLKAMKSPTSKPVPKDAANILAIIHGGRAEGRQEILDSIHSQANQQNYLWIQLELLKRLDRLDK